jgi:hypothetical protein
MENEPGSQSFDVLPSMAADTMSAVAKTRAPGVLPFLYVVDASPGREQRAEGVWRAGAPACHAAAAMPPL